MKFHPDMINELTERITSETLKYPCSVVIGDNSSGKSFLIKKLVELWMGKRSVYFIDAVNRGFNASKVTAVKEKLTYHNSRVMETRLKEDYFNLQDSFNFYGTSTERIEQIYSAFEERVQQLFYELTGERFEIIFGDPLGEVQFGEAKGTLSSGYQAIIRILLELLYYDGSIKQNTQTPKPYIVIDEIDEFLSPRYAAKLPVFLRNHFSQMEFVMTTHSIDLVVAVRDANVIILDQNDFEVKDANDCNSYSEVQMIFQRVFGNEEAEIVSDIEKELRRLLNHKMNHIWSEDDEARMEYLESTQLSASQQLIYRQIKEW